jgi:hypothetical protein
MLLRVYFPARLSDCPTQSPTFSSRDPQRDRVDQICTAAPAFPPAVSLHGSEVRISARGLTVESDFRDSFEEVVIQPS